MGWMWAVRRPEEDVCVLCQVSAFSSRRVVTPELNGIGPCWVLVGDPVQRLIPETSSRYRSQGVGQEGQRGWAMPASTGEPWGPGARERKVGRG